MCKMRSGYDTAGVNLLLLGNDYLPSTGFLAPSRTFQVDPSRYGPGSARGPHDSRSGRDGVHRRNIPGHLEQDGHSSLFQPIYTRERRRLGQSILVGTTQQLSVLDEYQNCPLATRYPSRLGLHPKPRHVRDRSGLQVTPSFSIQD
jgi:hypothetical protein